MVAYTVAALAPNMDVANAALPTYTVTLLFFSGWLAVLVPCCLASALLLPAQGTWAQDHGHAQVPCFFPGRVERVTHVILILWTSQRD